MAAPPLAAPYDGNGNIAALVNVANGATEAAYEYNSFGELLRADGAYAKINPFRFSAKWQDEESGLINYGFRYYSAALGRFINRDPIEEKGGLNLYGFCANDGVNHWDYMGNSWLGKLWMKFRHTIISAVLAVIPVVGPILAMMYNAAVGAHYGGVKGMIMAFASGGYLGPILQVAASAYGLYQAFRHGNFLKNVWNYYASKLVANTASQLASYVINGPPTPPSTGNKIEEDSNVDQSARKLTFLQDFGSREEMNEALKGCKSGFYFARLVEDRWQLYETNGIYTNLVYVNGILGTLGRHMSLGVAHLNDRFADVKQFTVANNSDHGVISDIIETSGDLLGISSSSSRQLAAGLKDALARNQHVTLVAHSQGFATTVSAMRQLAIQGISASNLTIYPHAGAANSSYAARLATALDARLMPHVFSSSDLVPNIVGMNGNPLQALASLFAAPKLASNIETQSPHTLVNSGGGKYGWRTWAAGN